METASVTSANRRGDVNRSWGLIVLKTAYRDRYPKVTADIISENAQKIEEKVFEKASSNDHYDTSILRAYDTITMLRTAGKDRDMSSTEDSRKSTAGRTPRSTNGTCTPNQTLQNVMPIPNNRMDKMTKSVGPLTPIMNASREHMPSFKESKITVEDGPGSGKLDFFSTRIDASDVIMLIPFILEAGVQVVGEIQTVEQTQSITERQKISIGFLGIEKMFRALYLASSDQGINNSSTTRTQEVSVRDQEEILRRVKYLRKQYMNDIRTIYVKLGEHFDTPDCDKKMILNISNSLKKLEEVERNTYKVSLQTVHILDYVENIFKSAIEQYRYLLCIEYLPSELLQASKGGDSDSWASPSYAAFPAKRSFLRDDIVDRKFHNGDVDGQKDSRLNLDSEQSDNDDFSRYRSHCHEATDKDDGISHAHLRIKYRDIIKVLVPLVRAELRNYTDAKKIREQMCYVTAFLNLDNVTDRQVVRRAEKTIHGFYERFRHLLRGESSRAQVAEKRLLQTMGAAKIAPHSWPLWMRPAKTKGSDLKRVQEVMNHIVYELESEESDLESEKQKEDQEDEIGDNETEKLRMKWDESYNNEDCETEEGQKQKFEIKPTSDGDELDEVEENESDDVNEEAAALVDLSGGDGEKIEETDSETKDEEDDETAPQQEEPEELPKEKYVKMEVKEDAVEKEEAKTGEVRTERRTPRRSQRTSVIAARARRGTMDGSTSSSAKTPNRSTSTKGGSNTAARTRTPGRGPRSRKTPRKE